MSTPGRSRVTTLERVHAMPFGQERPPLRDGNPGSGKNHPAFVESANGHAIEVMPDSLLVAGRARVRVETGSARTRWTWQELRRKVSPSGLVEDRTRGGHGVGLVACHQFADLRTMPWPQPKYPRHLAATGFAWIVITPDFDKQSSVAQR